MLRLKNAEMNFKKIINFVPEERENPQSTVVTNIGQKMSIVHNKFNLCRYILILEEFLAHPGSFSWCLKNFGCLTHLWQLRKEPYRRMWIPPFVLS